MRLGREVHDGVDAFYAKNVVDEVSGSDGALWREKTVDGCGCGG